MNCRKRKNCIPVVKRKKIKEKCKHKNEKWNNMEMKNINAERRKERKKKR